MIDVGFQSASRRIEEMKKTVAAVRHDLTGAMTVTETQVAGSK
jgi:hypothetical protein